MSVSTPASPVDKNSIDGKVKSKSVRQRTNRSTQVRSVLAYGEPLVWLTGGALVLCVVMILALLTLVVWLGFGTFTPMPLVQVEKRDGGVLMGEVSKSEIFKLNSDKLFSESESTQQLLVDDLVEKAGDLSGIGVAIDEAIDGYRREVSSLDGRIETVRARVEALAAGDEKPSAKAFRRRDLIANDEKNEDLQKARVALVALEAQKQAIETQIAGAEEANRKLSELESLDAAAIMAANFETKRIALDALVRLAEQNVGEEGVTVRRRMLRTGNFELTGEHFHWVSDYEIADEGETRPVDAVTIERVAWGRFYGTPSEFTFLEKREPSEQEHQLQQLIEFFETNRSSLSDEDSSKLDAAMPALSEAIESERAGNLKAFVSDIQSRYGAGDEEIQWQMHDGTVKPKNDLEEGDQVVHAVISWKGAGPAWQQFEARHEGVRERFHQRRHLEKHVLGRLYEQQERARLQLRQAELDNDVEILDASQQWLQAQREIDVADEQERRGDEILSQLKTRFGDDSELARLAAILNRNVKESIAAQRVDPVSRRQKIESQIASLSQPIQDLFGNALEIEQSASGESVKVRQDIEKIKAANGGGQLHLLTASQQPTALALSDVVRAYKANQLSDGQKVALYLSRWKEFLIDEPREANSEGGVLPAIWGTVTMTLIMSIAVVPFGVLAALYLREYAKSGPIVSAIRIAINNLAGVPSIVFGVFGLGFFCYIIGGYIDGGPANAGFAPMFPARWLFILGGLAVISLAAFIFGLVGFTGRYGNKSNFRRALAYLSIGLWVCSLALFAFLLIYTPFFSGFYEANLPNPFWGKGGIVWAALTLALMTLPVVIVATEEALSAVPNSMREGSYGCGASKWQTIRRIVLPQALPGIMTGMILAMARGAGEVAPLMLVGAVKLAPELPLDWSFPYLHGNRSFMHLGFHIFDVGFQSQNSEAAKPMVYTTTLLLIVIITFLNILAIWLRSYLRKRFVAGQF